MENASKALIMAGSVLIALLIIGALLLMFNNLSSYQETDTQGTKEAQVIEFNNQYETYLRNDVRGSDIISLMNRISDYNTRKGDNSEEKFQQMKIDVEEINVGALKYDSNDDEIIKNGYTQDTINEKNGILDTIKTLENKYQAKYITSLSANISKVMDSEEETEKLLPKELSFYGGYEQVKKDTASYYQYSQFKRLHFDCDTGETQYNQNTGRIIYIKFKCTNKLS